MWVFRVSLGFLEFSSRRECEIYGVYFLRYCTRNEVYIIWHHTLSCINLVRCPNKTIVDVKHKVGVRNFSMRMKPEGQWECGQMDKELQICYGNCFLYGRNSWPVLNSIPVINIIVKYLSSSLACYFMTKLKASINYHMYISHTFNPNSFTVSYTQLYYLFTIIIIIM